jgi:hypothetical protein
VKAYASQVTAPRCLNGFLLPFHNSYLIRNYLFISKHRNSIMFAQLTSTMLLLASVAVAQTPSVVTFVSISPTPLSEGVLSIQTVAPVFSESACYEVCIMPPCNPCA